MIFFLSSIIGGNTESPSDGTTAYNNLVIGAIQSLESLPIIILAIYILHKNKIWWVALILFSSRFVLAISGMLLGYGRSVLISALLVMTLSALAILFLRGKRISNRIKMLFVASPFLIIVYFGVASTYRDTVGFDASLQASERQEILKDSIQSSTHSGNFITDAVFGICDRLAEVHGLELFGNAESGITPYSGWSLNDLEQAIFVYIPKIWFPNKGVGLGRDIMVEYGFTVWNNIPPTLLGDSFRRSGLFGVIIVYFLMGFVATALTINLNNRWGSFGPMLSLYVGLSCLILVSLDAMTVYNFYAYRIVSSGIVMYVLLRLVGILPKGTLKKSYRPAQLGKDPNLC